MADTTCHVSISLDGFVAGPDQSLENPIGGSAASSSIRWHTLAEDGPGP